ncbi:MAG: nitroreductase family protein [Desulfobacterales bacterium]|nr:MAG: nitroreductase family protein [Desulfobacterales bacterium]
MFMSVIQKRRSIRQFSDTAVESAKIDKLVEAALRAPSSRGLNPWEFVVVTDRKVLAKLGRAKEHGSAFMKNAAVGFVVCANPGRSDVWIEDASIATIMIQLAAASLDLGSCWIQIRARMHNDRRTAGDYIAEVLNLPPELQVESMVAVGYPAEQKAPHAAAELQYEKVHRESYGKAYK